MKTGSTAVSEYRRSTEMLDALALGWSRFGEGRPSGSDLLQAFAYRREAQDDAERLPLLLATISALAEPAAGAKVDKQFWGRVPTTLVREVRKQRGPDGRSLSYSLADLARRMPDATLSAEDAQAYATLVDTTSLVADTARRRLQAA